MARSRGLGPLHPYVFAVSIVILATVLRVAADPWLGHSVPYLFFYPGIVVAATYGGVSPGILATGLSGFIAVFLYLAPVSSLMVRDTGDIVALVLFLANGFLISRVGGMARRAAISQEHLAGIVQSSDDAIVSKDLNGIIQTWNPGAERLFQFSAADAVGQPITIIIPPDRLTEEERLVSQIRAGRRVQPYETVRRRKDGTQVDVSLTLSPIWDAAGVVVGASKIARDISERRRSDRIRDELVERERIARDDAESARDRLAFLAEVAPC